MLDLTQDEDQDHARATRCICTYSCNVGCVCCKTGGACSESCSYRGGHGCELCIKSFDALFGTHQNIKLTPCFLDHICYALQDTRRRNSKPLTAPRLLELLRAQKTGIETEATRRCFIDASKNEYELRELVASLLLKVLAI